MVVEVGIGTGEDLAVGKVFGFKGFSVGGEDEFGLVAGGGGTQPKRGEGGGYFAFGRDLQVDVIALEHPAQIGFVRVPALEPFEGGLLVAEGFEKGMRRTRSCAPAANSSPNPEFLLPNPPIATLLLTTMTE